MNCSRSCGSTNIPFPVGFEPGCYSTRFQLNCASNRTLIGRPPAKYEVTNISLDDGLLYVNKLSEFEDANMNYLSIYTMMALDIFMYGLDKSDLSEEFGVWRWSGATLHAKMQKMMVHMHSVVLIVSVLVSHMENSTLVIDASASPGIEGNPYVQNGCTGVSTGIGSGFGVLDLALGAIALVRRLKRGAQKKIRRAFFRINKGLLLEHACDLIH